LPRLTAIEIANLGRQAGWRDDRPSHDPTRASELSVAVAIALSESGGRPNAVNAIGATGLWQIYPGSDDLKDPLANAHAAYAKYLANDSRFGSGPGSSCLWSVYCSRTYLVNLPAAEVAVRRTNRPSAFDQGVGAVAETTPGISQAGTVVAGAKSLLDVVKFAVLFLTSPNTWLRVGEVLAGSILVLFGLWVLFSQTKAGQSANAAVGTAAKGAVIAA